MLLYAASESNVSLTQWNATFIYLGDIKEMEGNNVNKNNRPNYTYRSSNNNVINNENNNKNNNIDNTNSNKKK